MDYAKLWFVFWAVLWTGYFALDGFDLGVGFSGWLAADGADDRRNIFSSIGPFWDGNEVWLITAGGVTFAAFPAVYATMFSALYTPLMLILFALIIRGVSIEFRNQIESQAWKRVWDTCFFIGSSVPALLFGVAFANIFKGIPIDENGIFHGNLLTLLNPYGLLGGVEFLLLFMLHGALWLGLKTQGDLHDRAARTAEKLWPLVLVFTLVFVVASYFSTDLFVNYFAHPALFLVIIITVAAIFGIRVYLKKGAFVLAWAASSLTIVGATFFGVIGLFPTLFGSSMDAAYSLTAFNASSSPLTLKIMLGVVLVFIPLVIAYQVWAYSMFMGKITDEDLDHGEGY